MLVLFFCCVSMSMQMTVPCVRSHLFPQDSTYSKWHLISRSSMFSVETRTYWSFPATVLMRVLTVLIVLTCGAIRCSPGLIRQLSNDGIPRSHGLGTEERPVTAEISGGLTLSQILPPDEGLQSGNLTPLKISRHNNNMFRVSKGLPQKHANSGLGNVLAAITSKPKNALSSITSELNGAAMTDSLPRRSDGSGLSKALAALTSSKATLTNIKAESNLSGASGSQSDTRSFPRRSDSADLANANTGLGSALSTLDFRKAAPHLNITSESKSARGVDTIADDTSTKMVDITPRQSDSTPRQSDSTISPRKSGNTPRNPGGAVVSFLQQLSFTVGMGLSRALPHCHTDAQYLQNPLNAKFQLSLNISNILNKEPVAAAEAVSHSPSTRGFCCCTSLPDLYKTIYNRMTLRKCVHACSCRNQLPQIRRPARLRSSLDFPAQGPLSPPTTAWSSASEALPRTRPSPHGHRRYPARAPLNPRR